MAFAEPIGKEFGVIVISNGVKWEVVIGLETHTQLSTQSKIFSGASTAFGAAPNTQASPVDLALPGVLPVINIGAIECAIKFGLAVGAEVAKRSIFARKNYFYPDLPKGIKLANTKYPSLLAASSRLLGRALGESSKKKSCNLLVPT
jgi:aspartyl-tRNA(Asn)/glutamyl-tRNA(Gln) amidotransferase subunit B